MYAHIVRYIIHKFPFKFSLDLQVQGRIWKPSKRKEGVDPLLPITPAKPAAKTNPPPPPGPYASRRIQGSQNRAAAAVLFTPRKQQQGPVRVPANQYPPPSPTPQRVRSPLKTGFTLSSNSSSSDTEDDVRIELEKLDLQSRSGSRSGSGSPSQSPRQPHAGPHSTQRKVQRPKGGANDVWKFFEKSPGRHTCVFCKYVHYFPHSHADTLFEYFIGRFIVLIPAIMLLISAVPQVHQICGSTFLLII